MYYSHLNVYLNIHTYLNIFKYIIELVKVVGKYQFIYYIINIDL